MIPKYPHHPWGYFLMNAQIYDALSQGNAFTNPLPSLSSASQGLITSGKAKPKAGVAEVCLIEVYVDSCNNEQCYFMVDTMVYVPASHLNRDFVTTENVVRWEIATQSDIDEHNIL